MTADERFAALRPGDPDGAKQVLMAFIAESGDVAPELIRMLAKMQKDPVAFVGEVSELLEELDEEEVELEKEFDEGLHPRDDHGRFASGSGGAVSAAAAGKSKEEKPAKEKKPPKAAKVVTPEERKARQAPDHWLPALSRKYGGVTGYAIAMGKAAQYRGREMPTALANEKLKALAEVGGIQIPNLFGMTPMEWIHKGSGVEFKTIGEAIEHFETKPSMKHLLVKLKASAALVGHLESIEQYKRDRPIVTGEVRMRDAVISSGAERDAQTVMRWQSWQSVKKAADLFQVMTGNNMVHPEMGDHDFVVQEVAGRHRGHYVEPSMLAPRGTVNLGKGALSTAVHEWGHALEAMNPVLKLRAQEFLDRRTKGEASQLLKSIFPVSDYESNEVTRADGFYHPYMGKDYGGRATEITSMLVQQLVVDGGLEQLVEHDEESMHFLFGQLRGDLKNEEQAALERIPKKPKPSKRSSK